MKLEGKSTDRETLLGLAIETCGEDAQMMMAIEEYPKLIKAL